MPLPVAHSLVGAIAIGLVYPKNRPKHLLLAMFAGAFIANCPDLDFILNWATGTKVWHRGFTHSITFSLTLSFLAAAILGRVYVRKVFAFGLAYMSHGLLDFATTLRGGGVKLLWPFSEQRLALRLVGLSEIPRELAPLEIVSAMLLETLIFLPLFLAVLFVRLRNRFSELFD